MVLMLRLIGAQMQQMLVLDQPQLLMQFQFYKVKLILLNLIVVHMI